MRIALQIDEIIAFLRIAEKSSFKAAAEELFVSQPALSRRIERLETAIGTRLLERTTRRVSLTKAGEQFCRMRMRRWKRWNSPCAACPKPRSSAARW